MADPVTIATMGMTAAGGILGAFGAAQKDDATSNMYKYKAGVAQANAQISAENAQYETQLGDVQAEQAGLAGGQRMGQIAAAQGASGIMVSSDSSQRVRTGQLMATQTNEAEIRNAAARRAFGYNVQGMDFKSEAGLDTAAAADVQTQKGFDVASSLLGGATSVGKEWMTYKQNV